jgi:hypothetical protein
VYTCNQYFVNVGFGIFKIERDFQSPKSSSSGEIGLGREESTVRGLFACARICRGLSVPFVVSGAKTTYQQAERHKNTVNRRE